MCFRPPTAEAANPTCPKCGHENFIGVMKCAKCGEPLIAGPIGTASAASRDWTPGLEFQQNAAPTGAAKIPPMPGRPPIPTPPRPSAPKPPSA